MNKLSDEKRAMILKALVEGNSMRATARLTSTSKNTVSRLLKNVGTSCMDQHDALVKDVESKRVQCDEIWSFCGAKERNVPKDERGQGRGDVWTWTALCQDSKLMIAYRVGCRSAVTGVPFMQDLADRLVNRVHLSTDGHGVYPRAVERAFGWGGADYGTMVKVYRPDFGRSAPVQPARVPRSGEDEGNGKPRHGGHLHVACRAVEPDATDALPPIHSPNERFLKEGGVPSVRRGATLHVL